MKKAKRRKIPKAKTRRKRRSPKTRTTRKSHPKTKTKTKTKTMILGYPSGRAKNKWLLFKVKSRAS